MPPGTFPDGYRGAVSLTHDDATADHLEVAGPALSRLDLRATFYTPLHAPGSTLLSRPSEWRALAKLGNELGNHTVSHPCRCEAAHRANWPTWRDLRGYTPERWLAEAETAGRVLGLIDDRPWNDRTFGPTCHHMTLGPPESAEPLEPLIRQVAIAGRGVITGAAANPANPMRLGCVCINRWTGERICAAIDELTAGGGWAILVIHRINADGLTPAAHEQMLEHLAVARDIWTAPVRDVVKALA